MRCRKFNVHKSILGVTVVELHVQYSRLRRHGVFMLRPNSITTSGRRPTETLTSKAIQGATRSKGGGAEDPIDGDGSSTVVHANYSFQRKFVPIEIGLLVWSRRP
ncbi:uncharacterized protein ARMOST_12156 [Armillaria ostoyae]|uniref:Uncharacterized protein n=1 Tax=Armillaria ostoyae TaxID=47428 RepID=A0A284RJ47_ARMOS|nr:uncharacterized protein ARMOST_12156 [Armillaria ostoyae]